MEDIRFYLLYIYFFICTKCYAAGHCLNHLNKIIKQE